MDFAKLMQQAHAAQEALGKAESELAGLTLEGVSGGGLVRVTLNGRGEAVAVRIDPSLLKPEEKALLEDLLMAAFADAKRRVDEAARAYMQKVAAKGLADLLPPGMRPGG